MKIFELVSRSVTSFYVTRHCNSRIPNVDSVELQIFFPSLRLQSSRFFFFFFWRDIDYVIAYKDTIDLLAVGMTELYVNSFQNFT